MSKLNLVERIKKYSNKKLLSAALLVGISAPGCGAIEFYQMHYPKKFDQSPLEYVVNRDEDGIYRNIPVVQKSRTNKYALLVKGNDHNIYVEGDIKNMAKLLLLKDYSVYYVNPNSSFVLSSFCERLGKISDDKTKLFVLLTGHGGPSGFPIGYGVHAIVNRIQPSFLFKTLQKVRGKKAVLIQGCHSGIFYDHLDQKYNWWGSQEDSYFNGVLLTSCSSKKISLSDPLTGMSSFVYGFCHYFAKNPEKVEDLSKIEFSQQMNLISELVVAIRRLFGSSYSYHTKKFSTTNYKF